ncbi:hypothetical protein MUK42_04473 [Musa troglodytarum]|uniref:Uncharacterized protein n=1 Tax=Musa troglodytarum TaxID=320322 RepID=A0A9E7K9H3_9LILI|nr:hypothetical protein MUK42_04473 [Musa troglodytarum]
MGNSLSGKKRIIKVMKVDGTSLKLKPPAHAESVLRDCPGYDLLESEQPGRLRRMRRCARGSSTFSWSCPGLVGADAPERQERLESLMLTHRTTSGILLTGKTTSAAVEAEEGKDGTVRLKMRLPKAEMEKLMRESKTATEAAAKIAELCVVRDGGATKMPQLRTPAVGTGRKEVRAAECESLTSAIRSVEGINRM